MAGEAPLSVADFNHDIFDCYTSKMQGRELAYLKNQKHVNLTSAVNSDIRHADLYGYYCGEEEVKEEQK